MKKMNMKKIYLGVMLLSMSNVVLGASVDHIQNYTPEYNANPALNGAISPTTSAYYNPAGLMQIENGRYFQVGISGAVGEQSMTSYGTEYDADSLDFIPNLMYVDKNDDRAVYFTFGGLAGGAEFDYEDGTPLMKTIENGLGSLPWFPGAGFNPFPNLELDGNEYAKGSNKYVQATLGRAWFVTEKLSVSAAARGIYGSRELEVYLRGEHDGDYNNGEISAEMDAERKAWGYGFSFGANYAATDRLNLAARYDTKVKMSFRGSGTSDDDLTGDVLEGLYGQYFNKTRRDLPAILALGAQYKITDRWTGFLSGNYYFNESADLDDEYRPEAKDHYKDGWEVAVGSEYQVTPRVAWLAGVNYASTGAGEETYHDSEFALDSVMLGTGIKFAQNPDTIWVLSVTHYIYDSETVEGEDLTIGTLPIGKMNDIKYSKEYTALGLSLTKRF